MAQQERRGIPVDLPMVTRIRQQWNGMRLNLVRQLDEPFGCYEIVNGAAHWRKERFADYIRQRRMSWPQLDTGALDETDQTFREMAAKYPHIEPLRELRYSLSKLRLSDLAIGAVLITPPPGRVLVHRDFSQQEVRIAAVLSGDTALLEACEGGDVYLGIAEQLGFLSVSMNDDERKAVRTLFKIVVLGIQYGLGARSLPCAPAFHCRKPTRFWRGYGRASIDSNLMLAG
jgi:DNA polymerase-1